MKKTMAWLCATALAFTLTACNSGGQVSSVEAPDGWPTTGLVELLPIPPGSVASVDNGDDTFDADIEECSVDEYNEYVTACEDAGFTVDAEKESNSYEAYSEDGHKLELYYWDSNETMDITLDAPIEMSEITWPTMGAASLVPAPESTTGFISSDSSTYFYAYIGETDEAAFADYINTCGEAGFTVDYDKGDTWYHADDARGNQLSLRYIGFNIMTVDITASDEPASDVAAEDGGATEVSADFKATMDSYEAFFNEYVEFIQAYEADPSSPDLLAQYADIMTRYSEMAGEMEAIDEESLSAADYAYYIEVTGRITAKLAEIGQ